MRRLVIDQPDIGPFMKRVMNTPSAFLSGRSIGVVNVHPDQTADLIAGVWYEGFNGANMVMHIAALPNSAWMTKELLWYMFHYPFVECGCRRITGLVEETNEAARNLAERLGCTLEARLKDAAPGGDILVYAMFREDCRWLKLHERVTALRTKVH